MSIPITVLENLNVLDFGLGLPAALVSRMLADLGARIQRIEPSSGDPFYDVYPAYTLWRRGTEISKAESAAAIALDAEILAGADICVVGGEDFPGLEWTIDARALALANPRLVILRIGGHVHDSPEASAPSVDLLVQAWSGLVHEQYSDRPMVYALPAPSYGAALQGMAGLLAALIDRERTGKGQIVHTSLFEGTLSWLGYSWFASERSDPAMDMTVPKDVRPLIFRCADGGFFHAALVSATARADLYRVLGIEEDATEGGQRGHPSLARGAKNFFGDFDLLQSRIIHWKRPELLEKLWALGMAVEPVCDPGEAWNDAQVIHNRSIWREADGERRVGLPFTIDSNAAPPTAQPAKTAEDAPPLDGIRIADFGAFAAGPHASMVLADLGADVIKVEPLTGDPVHGFYRPYSTSNRGKRHLAVDVKTPEGLEIALRLCRSAGMVHHNFRPGVAKRLGIDAQALHRIDPALIVLENSGYGPSGPKSRNAGIDYAFQALCGHEVQAGGENGAPTCYNATTVDFSAGLLGAIAALAAQYHKLRAGAGATIVTTLVDTGLFLLSELVQSADGGFMALRKLNATQTGFHPAERLYRARNGWIAIAARSEGMARRLLPVLGLTDEINEPRSAWGEKEERLIAGAIALEESGALLSRLENAEVWAAPCRENAKETGLRDEAALKRGTIVSTSHPVYGEIRQIGAPFSFSRARTRPRGDTPAIGRHSREILRELGYSSGEIDGFYARSIVAG